MTSWNRAAEELFGYTAAGKIGQSVLRLYPPDLVKEERGLPVWLDRWHWQPARSLLAHTDEHVTR